MFQFRGNGYLLSFALHFIFVWVLWEKAAPIESKKPEFQLTLSPAKIDSSKKEKKSKIQKSKKKQTHAATQGKRGKGSIYQTFSPAPYHTGTFEEHQASRQEGWEGNAVMETMNGMGLTEYTSNHYFFETLIAKLNQGIPYPEILWEHKIKGKVWVKIRVNRKGRLLQIIDSSREHATLRAYILINIYQALRTELPKRYWYDQDKELALYLHFDYSVSSIHNIPGEQSARFFKNRVEFKRVAKIPNILEEAMHDYARYVPPIAPTPFGPIVNFVQVYNMINAWADDDPLVKKRNRKIMTSERLQLLLDKRQREHSK